MTSARGIASGIATIRRTADMRAGAPRSGLHLGAGLGGPVTLRAFRPAGTRLAAVCALPAVHLLTARAAAGGIQVRVLTDRPQDWQAVLARGRDALALSPGSGLPPPTGPSLVVDDRSDETRRLGETVAWRCRIDVRTPSTAADLRTLTGADLLLLGAAPPELALAATTALGVPVPDLSRLTAPDAGTVAVLRRGRIDHVRLDRVDAAVLPAGQLLPTASRRSP